MKVIDEPNELDELRQSFPALLEREAGWAPHEVLDAGVAGYTCDHNMPEGHMIRHNPDGTRQLVQINLDGPDTVIHAL
jgi:hypothetical protein